MIVNKASEQFGEEEPSQTPVDSSACESETISCFLYFWLVGKLNTEMHDKTGTIQRNNGLDL